MSTEQNGSKAGTPSPERLGSAWRSCARWEHKHGFQDDLTMDVHRTREAAQAVCDKLMRDGLGGERCHFPFETWVERVPNAAGERTLPAGEKI